MRPPGLRVTAVSSTRLSVPWRQASLSAFSLSNFQSPAWCPRQRRHLNTCWTDGRVSSTRICSQVRRGRLLLHTVQSGWNSPPLKTGAKSSITFLAAKSSKYLQRPLSLGWILSLESTSWWPPGGREWTSLRRLTSVLARCQLLTTGEEAFPPYLITPRCGFYSVLIHSTKLWEQLVGRLCLEENVETV